MESAVMPVDSLAAPAVETAPWPHFGEEEIAAVGRVLRSGKVNYWTGEEGRLFEREFASACSCAHGVALANGTIALELALRALGIGLGDEVITSARTFIASASCAAMVGARPVLVDVDRDSQNLTAGTILPAISDLTRAIIVVHLNGLPCDMDPILELAAGRRIPVIEDCSQAHGATYKGRVAGSMGCMGTFSFCQDKIITTGGEGGLVTTNDGVLRDRVWSLKDHGKRPEPSGAGRTHERFGTNGRMTEMQAAIGRVQLRRLPGWLAARRRNAGILAQKLGSVRGLRVTTPGPHFGHAWYRFSAFVEPELLRTGWSRDRIAAEIAASGGACVVWGNGDISREKAFAGWAQRELPVVRELAETSLLFLVHPTLTEQQMRATCDAVREVMAEAAGS
jgi:dTDP-4-amino-4,6-dideoxygalactose transaminase